MNECISVAAAVLLLAEDTKIGVESEVALAQLLLFTAPQPLTGTSIFKLPSSCAQAEIVDSLESAPSELVNSRLVIKFVHLDAEDGEYDCLCCVFCV